MSQISALMRWGAVACDALHLPLSVPPLFLDGSQPIIFFRKLSFSPSVDIVNSHSDRSGVTADSTSPTHSSHSPAYQTGASRFQSRGRIPRNLLRVGSRSGRLCARGRSLLSHLRLGETFPVFESTRSGSRSYLTNNDWDSFRILICILRSLMFIIFRRSPPGLIVKLFLNVNFLRKTSYVQRDILCVGRVILPMLSLIPFELLIISIFFTDH